MKLFYRLEGRTPVAMTTIAEVAEAAGSLEDKEGRTVRRTKIGPISVSTVFTVIDLSMGLGPPLLFESMIFGGKYDGEQQRYATFEEAEWGHFALICKVWMGEDWKDGRNLDLQIFIQKDGEFKNVHDIHYTILDVTSDEEQRIVGPARRQPVNFEVGHYAAYVADLFEDPGYAETNAYRIVWRFRETESDPPSMTLRDFRLHPKDHYPTDDLLPKAVPKGRSAWEWLAEDD
jgi:hypothetical protein